ncbi:MAG: TetR/AcrR family transcriptional regulator [Actinomycetota bacterium]|nr:TetR/AcrR family transcriptional regulator [Actinomycetota bacterium]
MILDATEEVLLEDGYGAVSSRSVATAAGIKAPLVHYYFPTIDDLLVALLRRRSDSTVGRMSEALTSDRPLASWWEAAADRRGTSLFVELMAAANHRPLLKAEFGGIARDVRRMQMDALETLLPEYGLDAALLPPPLVAAAIQGLAFSVITDQTAGYDTHPEEALAAMGRLVAHLETRRAASRPSESR